jgi:hypothetical protein
LKFKTEAALLILAIILFAVAMFCYSYHALALGYPYRGLAVTFVGIGSVSMLTASISYSKKTKDIIS